MRTNKLEHKDVWNFSYKGISCEIVHWGVNPESEFFPKGTWNGYIYINKKMLPKQFRKLLVKQISHRFGKSSTLRKSWEYYKLENYFDMHGGITYYELILDQFTGKPEAVKVGCDYAHSCDQGMTYEAEDVKKDLEKSVDIFIESFPNYLVWDFKDGKYKNPELVV